jgi:hypothetical protein
MTIQAGVSVHPEGAWHTPEPADYERWFQHDMVPLACQALHRRATSSIARGPRTS